MQRSFTLLETTLDRYGTQVRKALIEWLPVQEPRRHLYDLVADYPLRSGKMLRPSLCIAACRAFGGAIEEALDSAVAIELMHNAFLIHDDIEDGSALRRGGPTLQLEHGVPLALNAGDGMTILSIRPLLRNLDLLAPGIAQQILEETLQVAQQTVEGQAMELGWRRDNACDVTPEDYLRMILKKTCWYTAIHPLRVGAMIGVQDVVDPTLAAGFGFFLGAAFQIRDDILNVIGGKARYGKETGDDIYEGKRTLLLIHLLERLDVAEKAILMYILSLPRERREPEQVCWVIDRMQTHGSIDYAWSYAHGLVGAALYEFDRTFGDLPSSEDKQFIYDLALYLAEREE